MPDVEVAVVAHATLYLRAGSTSILVDPWFSGSAFWRSWWHLPAPAPLRDEWLRPDFVYITHHHFDHLHYPSMRRLDRRARVLIPRFGVDVMRGEIERLGFSSVTELEHGRLHQIADDVVVASYQYGADDTLFAMRIGDVVVVDVNDCKIRGAAMARVRRDFGAATLMLKSHSWAQAYPWCYEADDPDELGLITPDVYLQDFVVTAQELDARYAIPFGSGVAFLERESEILNDHVVTAEQVERVCGPRLTVRGTETVIMRPGDTWNARDGFRHRVEDEPLDRATELVALRARAAGRLEDQRRMEAGRSLSVDELCAYLTPFVRAIPRPLFRRAVPRPVAIRFGDHTVALDFAAGRVTTDPDAIARRATLVDVDEGLLSLAVEQRIVHLLHPAARVHVQMRRGALREDTAFWGALMMWELGYLPARRSCTPRAARVVWRRRAEFVAYAGALRRRRGALHERMADLFASVAGESDD
jgi:UDP-MurNAc hydroxylase